MGFLLKANEQLLWAHFLLFSVSLFPLLLSNLLLSLSAFSSTNIHPSLSFLFPRQRLIHPASLWGAACTIKVFVGELSPTEGCSEPDQPPSGATAGLRD